MQRELITPADARVLKTMYRMDGLRRWLTLAELVELSELSDGAVSASLRRLDELRLITTPRRGALRSEGVAFTTLADSRRIRGEVDRVLRAGADELDASHVDAGEQDA